MRQVALYTHERTFWHATGMQALFLPVGGWVQPPAGGVGADTPESKRRILSLLSASGLVEQMRTPRAQPATRADLARVHTQRYLDAFAGASAAGWGDLGDVAPFGPGAYEIACLSAGLAKAAVADVLSGEVERAYALCRPAGHHCLPDRSMGFCLLCNIPIAIEAARASHGLGRVAVVDWDVHHGNGTQAVYYERGDVLTISLHQERCFPPGYTGEADRGAGAGLGANLNIPLPPGCGHAAYLAALDEIVLPALERFAPELIIIASGLDANGLDPLARMLLHSGTYRAMTARLCALADRLCGGRLVVVHEGGYSEAYVPFCGHAVAEALLETASPVVDPAQAMIEAQQPAGATLAFQLETVAQLAQGWRESWKSG
ncbi:MAG TPA: class II histone deacetylase [Novosphingobium sp.]|nr:class II histone deacetylase [Novosphingobium sp.]HZV09034.1 class II histone deacetylase [Novosphingobium sp.]